LTAAVQDTVLSQALLPAFAEQSRGMSANEIDRTMQSFAFQNCQPRKDIVDLLRRCLSGE